MNCSISIAILQGKTPKHQPIKKQTNKKKKNRMAMHNLRLMQQNFTVKMVLVNHLSYLRPVVDSQQNS